MLYQVTLHGEHCKWFDITLNVILQLNTVKFMVLGSKSYELSYNLP